MQHKSRAFTLIELLVVVLIIGILAAVAVPQYEKAVWKARATEAKVNLSAIARAQQIFYIANGEFTSDLSLLDIEVKNSSSVSYVCNLETTPVQADCWANMSKLRYNFPVTPKGIGRFCIGKKGSIAEEICKASGTYKYDTSDGESSYYKIEQL